MENNSFHDMHNSKHISSAFLELKPLCVEILKNCNIKNIEKLKNVLVHLDNEIIVNLQEFIILPFRAHLSSKLSENLTITCIDIIKYVIKKSSVTKWCFFADLFMLMVSKISDPQDINKVSCSSEELKLSICENISALVQYSEEEVLNEMYSLSFRPNLAHAFYTLNLLLIHEKSKILRKSILSTIGVLTYNETYLVKIFKKTEEIASESLASCLPGLSITLQKIASGDNIQGHNIIVMALNALEHIIVLVVSDESYNRGIARNPSSDIYHIAYKCGKNNQFLESVAEEQIPVVIKNEEWYRSVSEKLAILVTNLTSLVSHDNWKVRLQYLKFIGSLIFKCSKTLENCIPILLPSVFSLSVDDNEEISLSCEEILLSLSKELQSLNNGSLNSIIEDNIDKLALQLMKCKVTANDNRKLALLKSLLGYLEIFSLSINKFIFSMVHLERILLTIITLLEFDISMLNLVEEIPSLENFCISSSSLWPKKRFKFFENKEILSTISKICYTFGRIENSRLLIDYLLDKLSSNSLYTLQCLFIIGNIVQGLTTKKVNIVDKNSELINDILEIFISPSMFDLSISDSNSVYSHISEKDASKFVSTCMYNKNILQICLILEAIAYCSEYLADNFKEHLTKVLCNVMEKAGSSNFIISQCGQICLYYIAKSCNYNSVQALIKDNADYITNIIMINFQQYMYKTEVVIVLRVVMEQCDSDAIILFRDLIYQILNILDYNQDKAFHFMTVLFSVVHSIKKWYPSQNNHLSSEPSQIMLKKLRKSVTEYISLKKSACNLDPEYLNEDLVSEFESKDGGDDYTTVVKENIPLHINITCEIFKRCIHLQSSENTYLRMLTLETVKECILILRDYELQLHPLVHEFWNPFLKRFTEGQFISKAFEILLVIINECADFVRYRSFKEVIPNLIQFLKSEKNKSLLKCNYQHYQWSSDHKLQILVLSEIGSLCTKLDIDSKHLNDVVNACLPYLEKGQPKVLLDAAIKSLHDLSSIDSDAVWFYWNELFLSNKTSFPPDI